MLIHAYVNAYYCGKQINYPVRNQIIDILPIFILSSTIAILTYYFDVTILSKNLGSDLLRIIVNFIIYFTFYLTFSKLLRFGGLTELINIGLEGIKKIKGK
jgi:hypothetical protein